MRRQHLCIAKREGVGPDPCQDSFWWIWHFDIVYRGQPRVIMYSWSTSLRFLPQGGLVFVHCSNDLTSVCCLFVSWFALSWIDTGIAILSDYCDSVAIFPTEVWFLCTVPTTYNYGNLTFDKLRILSKDNIYTDYQDQQLLSTIMIITANGHCQGLSRV